MTGGNGNHKALYASNNCHKIHRKPYHLTTIFKFKIHIFRHHYRSFPGNFVIYSGFIKQLLMNTMNLQTKKEDQVFVNLLTDAGFKAVYADPANKQLLINLLNTVLRNIQNLGCLGSRHACRFTAQKIYVFILSYRSSSHVILPISTFRRN